jgi:hypothetical protein
MPQMNRAQLVDAPAGLLPLPRPLMTGEVLDAAFRLFRAGVLRTLPYSALAVLLLELPTLYATMFTRASLGADFLVQHYHPLTYALVFLFSVPLLGVIMLRLNSIANGRKPRFRTEISTALKRWPAGIIATLGAFVIPVTLLIMGPAFTNGLSEVGVILCAVVFFWPAFLFVVTLPAFWCAGRGPFAAIARSVRLSARRSWRMVGGVLAAMLIVAVFYGLVAIVIAVMTPMFGRADLFLISTITSLLQLVIGTFGMPFVLAVLIVAHQDLELRYQERQAVRS